MEHSTKAKANQSTTSNATSHFPACHTPWITTKLNFQQKFGLSHCQKQQQSDCRLLLGEAEEPLHMHLSADGWICLANKKSDPDSLTWDQAMRDCPDLQAWMAAIAKEIDQLEDKNCWVETIKDEA